MQSTVIMSTNKIKVFEDKPFEPSKPAQNFVKRFAEAEKPAPASLAPAQEKNGTQRQ